jgi:SMC interacting uncharacterized protein involved in chromosome segregation
LENQQLRVKEQALRNEREQNQEYRETLEKDLEGLTKKVAEGAGQVNTLHQTLITKKEELQNAVDLIRNNVFKLESLKQEITRLKGEIVTNPEELIQVIFTLCGVFLTFYRMWKVKDLKSTKRKRLCKKLRKKFANYQLIQPSGKNLKRFVSYSYC